MNKGNKLKLNSMTKTTNKPTTPIKALTIPAKRGWSATAKFQPFERVAVANITTKNPGVSNKQVQYARKNGTVIAVSSPDGAHIRNSKRQFTRYYVEFGDGYVSGFHSHYIVPVGTAKGSKRRRNALGQFMRNR